jgi:hypothetical protein
VTVGSVDLSVLSGEGGLEDLAVANPEGFSAPHVLDVGGVDVRLDPWSVLDAEGPVDVHAAELRDATVTVEAYALGLKTNVGMLKENIDSFLGAKRADDEEGADGAAGEGGAERRLRIERVSLKNARVQVVFHGPMRTFKRSVGLTDFELHDLGGREGAPAKEIAREVFMAVGAKAKAAMFRMPGPWQSLRNRLLENFDDDDIDRLKNAGRKLLDMGKALRDGASLRDLREAWQADRGGQADGGPEPADGGGAEPVKLREQLKTLRETIRSRREGRLELKNLGKDRIRPDRPALR